MHDWRIVLAAPLFRRFWAALLINNLGSWCVIAALPVLVAQRFGVGEELILSLGLRVLPKIALAPLAGHLLGRIGATRLAAGALTALGVLTALVPWCGDFAALQLLIAAIGTLDVFVMPALLSLRVPVTPPGRAMAGNTLCSVADRAAKIVGPVVGGTMLIAGFGPAFTLFGLLTLLAALMVLRLPDIPRDDGAERPSGRSIWRLPRAFAGMLATDMQLAGLLIAAVTYMGMLGGLRPFLFWANRDWFGASDAAWAWLLVAQGAGALLGGALAALFSTTLLRWFGAYPLTLLTGMLEGGLMLCLVFTTASEQAMAVLFLASVPEIISTASWFTAFQQRLPPQRQGEFFAFAGSLWDVAYVGGVAAGGLYASGLLSLSVYWIVLTLGATLPLLPLLLFSVAREAAAPRGERAGDPPRGQ